MPTLGQSTQRIDAVAKVKGEALYPGDINLPDQTYMKILFANRPHAIVKRIDTSEAESLEGVIAVFTARDVPVNEYGLITPDQPVLCGPGSSKPFADRVRFVGDQVALVVAETEEIAARGRDLIKVDYEDLTALTDPIANMKPDAELIHPDRGLDTSGHPRIIGHPSILNYPSTLGHPSTLGPSNVFCRYRIRKGDVEGAFARADVIVEGEYRTPAQEHAYLQPEAGLGYIDEDGRITVNVAGQHAHEDQHQIAHALDLPVDRIRVIYPAIGGAFGGREDMSVQIVLALAAWRLHQRGIDRPVKIIWSREESIAGHHKRHPYILRSRWGATKEGKVLAADVEIIADGGAYAYTSTKVLGNATLMCTGPYEIPNVKVDSYAVYTNNLPGGAFRGFGGPQAAFEAETQMNRLAEALGMDPVEIRLRNVLHEGALLSVGTPLPKGVSMPQVIAQCAQAGGWKVWKDESGAERAKRDPSLFFQKPSPAPHLKRGLGFAAAFKNVGFSFGFQDRCWATVELHGEVEIEQVVVYHAAAEVGQGTHTVISQMAAEAAGVTVEKVRLIASDTAVTDNSGSVSASRMTFMAGNSIKGAVEAALKKWRTEERPAIATFEYLAPSTTPFDSETGHSKPNFAYGYVAQAVTVEVDTETGFIHILDVLSANDVGKAINPQQVQGQIEGGVVMAAGHVLLENFIQKSGFVQTQQLSTYMIPTILDIPDQVESLILEYPDPTGPWGARGMGEMPFLPLAPAIIAAVHDATGVWFNEFPLTPERILRGLGIIA